MSRSGARPYIQLGSLYLVPIFPDRLSGAVMVRRALEELSLGPGDAIAVARPKGVEAWFTEAVGKLPRSTLIYISDPSAKTAEIAKELVTVTPCDGFAEAVRYSMESARPGIATHFVDLNVSPLFQRDRPECGGEPIGVDDWSCLTLGAEPSVGLFYDHPAVRRRRILPVDEWREKHMAGMLQMLHPRYRRTVAVLYIENVRGVQQALSQPRRLPEVPRFEGAHDRIQPKTSVLLQLLDDFPRVVETWQEARRKEDLWSFDKMTSVLDEVVAFASKDVFRWSMRHHQAFRQMLDGVMWQTNRRSLPLTEVLELVASCYDSGFSESVREHLLTFHDGDVSAEDVKHVFEQSGKELSQSGPSKPDFPQPDLSAQDPSEPNHSGRSGELESHPQEAQYRERVFVRGMCPGAPNFNSFTNRNGKNTWFNPRLVWPGWCDLHNELRSRVLRAAASAALATTSERFRGSLERGLDLRQMVRALYRNDPTLYVRRRRKTKDVHATPQSVVPVLWFFTSPAGNWLSGSPSRTWNRHDSIEWEKKYLIGVDWGEEAILVSRSWPTDPRRVALRQCGFMYSFLDMGLTQSEIDKIHGQEARRIPSDHLWYDADTIFRGITDIATSHICCLTPRGEPVPATLSAYVRETGKSLTTLAHADVGTADVKKLSLCVSVDNEGKANTRKNIRNAQELYGNLIKRVWN